MVQPFSRMTRPNNPIVILYSLIVLCQLLHLNPIMCSITSLTVSGDPSDQQAVLRKYSKSFSDVYFHNFTLFTLIKQNGKTSLFVVSKNDVIIEINTVDMKIVRVYRTDWCRHAMRLDCKEAVTINHLSEITLLNNSMMWFCYILPQDNYHSDNLPNCQMPKNDNYHTDLKWMTRGFTSMSNLYRTFSVQSIGNIFIGSFYQNTLMIVRAKLPDDFGKINRSQDLTTSIEKTFFGKNSHFLEAFQTQYEVYFVVKGPATSESSTNSRLVDTTWLIRVCKDDPGGPEPSHSQNFGTTAKAEIVCPVGTGTEEYVYTRPISASWSGDKLYVLFDSKEHSPGGKVVCVYDQSAFNSAFNGKMMEPLFRSNLDVRFAVVANPVKDICKKLSEKTLSDQDMSKASTISTEGLYRKDPIMPKHKAPLINLRNVNINSINTFRLSLVDPSTIIVMIGENFIRMVSHTQGNDICPIQYFRLDDKERIHQVKGDYIQQKGYVYISTNKRVLQLGLSMCEEYLDVESCITKGPSICGWDSIFRKCTLLTEDTNRNSWIRSKCERITTADFWSMPEKCNVSNDEEILTCTCIFCMKETGCQDNLKFKVINCQVPNDVDTYGEWSPWSECSSKELYQRRTRLCKTRKCDIRTVDYRKCRDTQTSVTTTSWTQWLRSSNSNYWISFRAKCPLNTLAPPVIEQRDMFCGQSCIDTSAQWSKWSDCEEKGIQFRLQNCSSFEGCPNTRTEVKSCLQTVRRSKNQQDLKNYGYSVIHIVLSILVASLVWIIIIVITVMRLFRCFSKHKKRSTGRKRIHKFQDRSMSNVRYRPPYIQQKSFLSETSNDYLCPNIDLSYNNQTYPSLTSTILSDHTTDISKSVCTDVPSINE